MTSGSGSYSAYLANLWDRDGMENPLQKHLDPVIPGIDHQCDAGYPALFISGLLISDSDERPTEVTHSERGTVVAEDYLVQDPPYVTRTGRTSKPPQRLICDTVWSLKASFLLSLANSQNQELLQNFFQSWINC